jgi:hypothetical protein
MNDRQENKLSRFYTIRQLCENNIAVWSGYMPFARSFDDFKQILPEIEHNRDIQMTDITGVGEDKAATRRLLIDRIWFVCTRLQSFATVSGDESLLRTVKMFPTTLNRSSDTNLIGRSNIIIQKASENISSLEPYGVTQQHVDELEATTSQFTTTLSGIKDAQSARSTATSALKRLFSEASAILRQRLDLDAHYFKNNNTDFYKQYITLRVLDKKGMMKKRKNEKEEKNSD